MNIVLVEPEIPPNTGNVGRGDTVAVIGCGGVGSAAVAGARLAGARRIIAVASWLENAGKKKTILFERIINSILSVRRGPCSVCKFPGTNLNRAPTVF
jgi:D-arabinose 1-dehydrogenase-like Zn-dependent alcohol dehydrogenase